MPRTGLNPMKWMSEVYRPERITVTTIVHIPMLQGYWAEALNVLKICIASLRNSTNIPFDLMVFDNGSCAEVQDYLINMLRTKTIQYLVLSYNNIGKTGAWNHLFAAAPGEIIVYTDSDVLFLPGWLEESLELLNTFPKVGMISAQAHRWSTDSCPTCLNDIKQSSLQIECGELLSQDHLTAQRLGLGDTLERYNMRLHDREDVRITHNGVSAYVGASHFQFLTTKSVLLQLLPFPVTQLVDLDEIQLETRLDRSGHWQLSTTKYLVHHMGNRVPDAETGHDGLIKLVPSEVLLPLLQDHVPSVKTGLSSNNRPLKWLLRRSKIKQLLRLMNTTTYKLLNSD